MRNAILSLLVVSALLAMTDRGRVAEAQVSISGNRWFINGQLTYPGAPAEGLLMNVRMINTVYEDIGPAAHNLPPGFTPEANTQAFVNRIPEYAAHGVRAFTVGLQGGMPGYEGAINSAFTTSGQLRPSYMDRVHTVIEACEQNGVVVILSCFYQRQNQSLSGREAIRNAVANTTQWIGLERPGWPNGYTNVVLEIANEYDHGGYNNWPDGSWFRSTAGQVELIQLAQDTLPGLLVSTSPGGHGNVPSAIAQAANFVLIHFNDISISDYPSRIAAAAAYGKPVVVNEDDKIGSAGASAAATCVNHGASWGFMHKYKNQFVPFEYDGAADDPTVYAYLLSATTETVNDAQHISNTIPSAMDPNQQVSVSITVQNTGTTNWTRGGNYRLGAWGDTDPFADHRQYLEHGESIAPGQQKTFTFTMTAPSSPGIYTTEWRMLIELVEWFGELLSKEVQVGGWPAITQHPQDQEVLEGGTATFTVQVTGDTPLTYQWQKDDSDLSDGGRISGATSETLQITDVNSGDEGNYRCVVSNVVGDTISNPATLTVTPAPCEDPVLLEAYSVMTHGMAGDFAVEIELGEPYAIEPRAGAEHRLEFVFDQPIDIGGAAVILSSGTLAGLDLASTDVTDDTLVATLAEPPDNNACLAIEVSGVKDVTGACVTAPATLYLTMIQGDVDDNPPVNLTDLSIVRAELYQPVTDDNFMSDVNADGVINLTDLSLVRDNLYQQAACP